MFPTRGMYADYIGALPEDESREDAEREWTAKDFEGSRTRQQGCRLDLGWGSGGSDDSWVSSIEHT
jgi:hypothetical protein